LLLLLLQLLLVGALLLLLAGSVVRLLSWPSEAFPLLPVPPAMLPTPWYLRYGMAAPFLLLQLPVMDALLLLLPQQSCCLPLQQPRPPSADLRCSSRHSWGCTGPLTLSAGPGPAHT
jgi:hypothetical protein